MTAGYAPLPVPAGCVDTADINQWLQNVNALARCAVVQNGGVTCLQVQDAGTGGGCIDIKRGSSVLDPNSEEAAVIDKKVLMGHVFLDIPDTEATRDRSDGPEVYTTRGTGAIRIELLCDGEVVASKSSGRVISVGGVTLGMIVCCPRNAKMEICITELEQVGNGAPINWNVCASLVCFQPSYSRPLSQFPSFYCAPEIPAGCTVGRAGFELLNQNLQAVCAIAGQGQFEVDCVADTTFSGAGAGVLHTMADDNTQYLVVGSTSVCATFLSADSYVVGGPTVSCGSASTSCIRRARPNSDTTPASYCFSFPITACGTCNAGDTITAGFGDPVEECDDPTGLGLYASDVTITSITQSYTVFTFRRTDPVAEGLLPSYPTVQLTKCIPRQSVIDMIAKADATDAYLDTVAPLNQYCQEKSSSYTSPAGFQYAGIMRPAFPPPVPGPPGIKKTMVVGQLSFCLVNTSPNPQQGFPVDIAWSFGCNGAPNTFVNTISTYVEPENLFLGYTGDNQAPEYGQGQTTICFATPILETVSCLTTESVTFDILFTADPLVEVQLNYDFAVVCI